MPSYNEAQVIQQVIKDSLTEFKNSRYNITLLVVNDGSKDTTTTEAKAGGAVVVEHLMNTGAGGATATGLRYAKKYGFDIAATMDADGQHAPDDVLKGIDTLAKGNADLLIGSRLIDNRGMSRVKIIGNKGLSFITFILFGVNSTDSQSGLRIFSRKAIEQLHWQATGYEFCSEMLWRAKQLKLTVSEYSIKAIYSDYSKGKGQNNWNAINIVKSLLKRRVMEFLG